MGNEASTPDGGGGGGGDVGPSVDLEGNPIPFDGVIALQSPSRYQNRQSPFHPTNSSRNDDDSSGSCGSIKNGDKNALDRPLRIQSSGSNETTHSTEDQTDGNDRDRRMERHDSLSRSSVHHPRNQSFDGGSLRGSLVAAEDNGRRVYRDPLLEAAAAGAAVRKAKQQQQQQRMRQSPTASAAAAATHHGGARGLQQQQQQQHRRQAVDNEWRTSLRRLATVAASTARTVAHVAAPVLADAKDAVVSTASEFAHDVREEWRKEGSAATDDGAARVVFVNDEETVALYSPTSSPFATPETPRSMVSQGSFSSGHGGQLSSTVLLPTFNHQFQQQQLQMQQQRTSEPSPSPSSTDYTNDYSAKWRESMAFSSVLPVNIEEEFAEEDDHDRRNKRDPTGSPSPPSNRILIGPSMQQPHGDSSPSQSSLLAAPSGAVKEGRPQPSPSPLLEESEQQQQAPPLASESQTTSGGAVNHSTDDRCGSIVTENGGSNEVNLSQTETQVNLRDKLQAMGGDETKTNGDSDAETAVVSDERLRQGSDEEMGSFVSEAQPNATAVAILSTDKLDGSSIRQHLEDPNRGGPIEQNTDVVMESPIQPSTEDEDPGEGATCRMDADPVQGEDLDLIDAMEGEKVIEEGSKVEEETILEAIGTESGARNSSPERRKSNSETLFEANSLAASEKQEVPDCIKRVASGSGFAEGAGTSQSSKYIDIQLEQSLTSDSRHDEEARTSSLMSWLPNPFHSSVDNQGGSKSASLLEGESRELNEESGSSFVESLAIYESAPEGSIQATQSVRNYHANVQTLEQCETDEQKEMCRAVCDETYKLACKLVAEQTADALVEGFQTRLLNDLRRLRELQKTAYGVEHSSSPSEGADLSATLCPPGEERMEEDVGSLEAVQNLDCSCGFLVEDERTVDLMKDMKVEEKNEECSSGAVAVPKKTSLHTEKDIKNKALFASSADSIYQTEETETWGGSGTKAETRATRDVVKPRDVLNPATTGKTTKTATEQNPLSDGKSIVKYVVTKLTGYDVDIRDKEPEISLVHPGRFKHTPIPESVFRQQTETKSISSYSLSSPPELDLLAQSDSESESVLELGKVGEMDSLFEYIPVRHEISTIQVKGDEESNDPIVDKLNERGPYQGLVKEQSKESVNESAGSLGTYPKSHDSVSFHSSPKRVPRRPRKDGNSRRTLKSPARTSVARSPYGTPVEDRSLVNDNQTELNLSDHGGQFVRWDNETEANFPSVPDTEEMTEALERSNLLDEALMTFSSLEDVRFLKVASGCEGTREVQSLTFLLWRQLVANWKHDELWKAMTSRLCTLPSLEPFDEPKANYFGDNSASISTIQFRIPRKTGGIRSAVVIAGEYSMLKSSTGAGTMLPEQDCLVLTRFLSEIAPGSRSSHNESTANDSIHTLQHRLPSWDVRKNTPMLEGDGQTITILQNEARNQLAIFSSVVDCIVLYAAQNDISCADFESSDITSSLNVKDYSAIRRKATRKYSGDVLQVKDVLRAQITFPNEGSLVCGLYGLHALANPQFRNKPFQSAASMARFEIVRLKNLFHATKVGTESNPSLPTGYRHILINIRFEGGLLAELQFQLAPVFGLMGEEGYSLHQDLVSARDDGKHNREVDFFARSILLNRSLEDDTSPGDFECDPQIRGESFSGNADGNGTGIGFPEDEIGSDDTTPGIEKNTKKRHQQTGCIENDSKEPHTSPFGDVGIAGAVAAAAAAKIKTKMDVTQKLVPNPIDGGGIAAAAAAAATSRGKVSETKDKMTPPYHPFNGAGAAAAAAAAARNRKKCSETDLTTNPTSNPVGSITAVAADTAKTRKKQGPTESANGPSGGGTPTCVAAANQNEVPGSGKPVIEIFGGGGMAAAAAAAAAAKNRNKQGPSESANGPSGGGTPTCVAAADQNKVPGTGKPVIEIFGGGGIAAAAAAAAAAKSHVKQDSILSESGLVEDTVATAAARSKREASQTHAVDSIIATGKQSSFPRESPLASISGGVAVAAAAASKSTASVRGKTNESEASSRIIRDGPAPPNKGEKYSSCRYTETELLAEALRAGIADAISNPRDLPAFFCLYLVMWRLQEESSRRSSGVDSSPVYPSCILESSKFDMSSFSRKLLLRCLAISNQATSIGMVGWLEYGTSNPLERTLNLPFEVLQQLACNLASNHDWARAADVLASLVMRCEQHLPLCHPTTLGAMLDLSGALSESGNTALARSIVDRVLDMLSAFLSDLESLYFDLSFAEASFEHDPKKVILIDGDVDVIAMLQAFATTMHMELSRGFLGVLGPNNRIWLLNHSLVGDAFSVLANCLSASEDHSGKGNHRSHATGTGYTHVDEECVSQYYWSLAYTNFEIAFKGWTKIESLSHANSASAAYSLARCLRELGKLDQALKILELVASCLEQKLDSEEETKANFVPQDSRDAISPIPTGSLWFVPARRESMSSPSSCTPQIYACQREQTAVLCFWMMAVLTVEQSPDERGRNRALSLLHTASMTLQRTLATDLDDQTRLVCLDLYHQVEGEALELFEPLQRIPLPQSDDARDGQSQEHDASQTRAKKASWEIMTPMREKRVWTSPRRQRARLASLAGSDEDPKAVVQLV